MTGINSETPEAEAGSAYENPLIPNARLRQIYLAMVRMRTLEKALPAARRARAFAAGGKAHAVGSVGLEACLASTSVDLSADDLVSDALSGGMVEFLRGEALRKVLTSGEAPSRGKGLFAGCGSAAALTAAPGIAERLWSVVGAAAALKARAAQAKAELKANTAADEEETKAPNSGVVVAYVRPGEVGSALWRRVLEHAAAQSLPILFVVMPAARSVSLAKAGAVSDLALRCKVAGIAVDQDDAVAIYRVMQESLGRAQAGGGATVIECVPFVLHGSSGKNAAGQDAIAGMERYLLQRKVVSKGWMEQETRAFARQLAAKS